MEQIKILQGEKHDMIDGNLVWDICRILVVCSSDIELSLVLSQDMWTFRSSNAIRWLPAGYAEFFKLRLQGYSVSWAGAKVILLSSELGLPDY